MQIRLARIKGDSSRRPCSFIRSLTFSILGENTMSREGIEPSTRRLRGAKSRRLKKLLCVYNSKYRAKKRLVKRENRLKGFYTALYVWYFSAFFFSLPITRYGHRIFESVSLSFTHPIGKEGESESSQLIHGQFHLVKADSEPYSGTAAWQGEHVRNLQLFKTCKA